MIKERNQINQKKKKRGKERKRKKRTERSIGVALEFEDGEATRDHDVLGGLAEVVVDTIVEEGIFVHQDDLLIDSFFAEEISNELGDQHGNRDGKEVVQISCGLENDDND